MIKVLRFESEEHKEWNLNIDKDERAFNWD